MPQQRVGGATCNFISTGGMWSAQEMKYHINILELLAVKLAIQTFTKYRDVKASSRQYCGLFDENGRYSKSEIGRVGQGNLGISFEVEDHNYCRIPPERIEFNSRLGISKHFGLLRVDAECIKFFRKFAR